MCFVLSVKRPTLLLLAVYQRGSLPCSCSKINNKYGYYPDRVDWTDTLYLLYYGEEDFYKIGRSFCLERRLANLKGVYKDILIIGTYNSTHKDVFYKEKDVHKICDKYRHKPSIPFGGDSECFSEEILRLQEIIDIFNINP